MNTRCLLALVPLGVAFVSLPIQLAGGADGTPDRRERAHLALRSETCGFAAQPAPSAGTASAATPAGRCNPV